MVINYSYNFRKASLDNRVRDGVFPIFGKRTYNYGEILVY